MYEDEIWKEIPNFENKFLISNYGRIKNAKKNTYRKNTLANNGYLVVTLWDKEKKQRTPLLIHRLVATVFVEGSGECVNHIDGKKTNNHYTNLEWCSLAYNTKHAYENKLINNHQSVQIIENGMKFRTMTECEKWLKNNGFPKATLSNISKVIQGKRHYAYGFTYKYIEKII